MTMVPIPISLPSRVEETLAPCPRFRILVVGMSGVGKSSLVSCIFNLKLNEIDIAHRRAGNANIDYEYTSPDNPRFILHDSQGFEAGSTNHWETVETFLRHKNSPNTPLNERIHAIWLCIQTPRTGSRLLETGDESLLTLADDLKISVIVVFTKFDLLINEHFKNIAHCEKEERKQKAQTQAQTGFDQATTEVRQAHSQVKCVKVSTHVKYRQRNETLKDLTNTTREILHDVEGELWVPWAVAQQVNARQKVDTSIEEGFKKYWVDLGRSTIFSGHKMVECIWRIHDDILKVWNFNDPGKLLAGPKFIEAMVLLVNSVVVRPDLQNNRGTSPAPAMAPSDFLSFAKDISPILAELFPGAGFGIAVAKLLYGLYEKVPLASQYLGAYIVDLTIILHNLFSFTLPKEPPRELTQELIDEALNDYKQRSAVIHRHICTFTPVDFSKKIKELISEELGFATSE